MRRADMRADMPLKVHFIMRCRRRSFARFEFSVLAVVVFFVAVACDLSARRSVGLRSVCRRPTDGRCTVLCRQRSVGTHRRRRRRRLRRRRRRAAGNAGGRPATAALPVCQCCHAVMSITWRQARYSASTASSTWKRSTPFSTPSSGSSHSDLGQVAVDAG